MHVEVGARHRAQHHVYRNLPRGCWSPAVTGAGGVLLVVSVDDHAFFVELVVVGQGFALRVRVRTAAGGFEISESEDVEGDMETAAVHLVRWMRRHLQRLRIGHARAVRELRAAAGEVVAAVQEVEPADTQQVFVSRPLVTAVRLPPEERMRSAPEPAAQASLFGAPAQGLPERKDLPSRSLRRK